MATRYALNGDQYPLNERRWHPLSGGTAVWVFMTVEVVTFGLFLAAHAWQWRTQAEVFREARAHLHMDAAVRGTLLLLTGSACAFQAVLANEAARHRATAGWLGGAAAFAVAFCVNKIAEYAAPSLAGITLSTNDFYFAYLFLTGLHLAHVAIGVVGLLYVAWRAAAAAYGPGDAGTVEAAAAYYHLVDVVWILVFPVLYGMHA